jgi:hypothetical protein
MYPPPHTGVFVLSLLALALSAWLVISTVLRKRRERRIKRRKAFAKLMEGALAKSGIFASIMGAARDGDAAGSGTIGATRTTKHRRRTALRIQLDETTAWGRLTSRLLRKAYEIGEFAPPVSVQAAGSHGSTGSLGAGSSSNAAAWSLATVPRPGQEGRSTVVHGVVVPSDSMLLPGSLAELEHDDGAAASPMAIKVVVAARVCPSAMPCPSSAQGRSKRDAPGSIILPMTARRTARRNPTPSRLGIV